MDPFRMPAYTGQRLDEPPAMEGGLPKLRMALPASYAANWGAQGGGPARRELSHNNGWLPTSSYLQSAYGVKPGVPAEEGMPEEVLDRIGKTSFGLAPPRALYGSTEAERDEEGPPARPLGLAEGMLGALTGFMTGLLPQDIQRPIVEGAQNVGNFADQFLNMAPLRDIPGQSVEEVFERVKDTPEKQRTRQKMAAHPTDAYWYMSEYLRAHGEDVTQSMGVPGLLAPVVMPGQDPLMRLLGTLGIAQQGLERTILGGTGRIQQVLADPTPAEPLREIRDRYLSGQFGKPGTKEADDAFLDALVTGGVGYSDDPFIQFLASMVDPLILTGGVTGLARGAVRAGVFARRALSITGAAEASANPVVQAALVAARTAEAGAGAPVTGLRRAIGRGGTEQTRVARRLMDDKRPEIQDVVRQGIDGMSRLDKAKLTTAPLVFGASRVADALNAPFGFFGSDSIARRTASRWIKGTTNGVFNGLGIESVARLYRAGGPQTQNRLNQSLGHAVSYLQKSAIQGNLIKMMRSGIKLEDGSEVPVYALPDGLTPEQVFKEVGLAENPIVGQEMEVFTRRVKELMLPDVGDVGLDPKTGAIIDQGARDAAMDAAMDGLREQAAKKVAYAGDMTMEQATAWAKSATLDDLATADLAFFGRMIEDFIDTQKTALKQSRDALQPLKQAVRDHPASKKAKEALDEGEKEVERMVRSTIIGERELTMERAADALASITREGKGKVSKVAKDKALRRAQSYMQRYEVLYQNLWTKSTTLSPQQLLEDMRVFLRQGIDEGRFVTTLKYDDLPQAYKDFVDRSRANGKEYVIGLAPDQSRVFRPVFDMKRGKIVGYHPWMDVKVDPAGVNAPTRLDIARNRLFSAIRAENIMQESRRKFISLGVKTYGLDRGASIMLYEAVRESASARKMTMRGFTTAEFQDIMDHVDIPDDMKTRLGQRGLAELTVRALEGDVRMVGLSSKLTGAMKTQSAHYGNYIGILAEKIYPIIRFNLNPIFLIQEWIEPYFFNILRGQKVGFNFSPVQTEMHHLLDQWNMAAVLADGFEAREFQMTGAIRGRRGFGPQTRVGRLAAKLPVSRKDAVKELNYSILTKSRFGELMYESWQKQFPGRWQETADFYQALELKKGRKGILSKGDIAARWWAHRGLYDPDSPTTFVHHYDGAIADNQGRVAGIRTSHLAKEVGYDSGQHLRDAVAAGAVDEWDFRETLVTKGFTPEYATRAWDVARGVSPEDLYESIREGYRTAIGDEVPAQVIPPTPSGSAIVERSPGAGIFEVTLPGNASLSIFPGQHGGPTIARSIDGAFSLSYPSMKKAIEVISRQWKLTADQLRAAGLGRWARYSGFTLPPATVIPATNLPATPAQIAARAAEADIAASLLEGHIERQAALKGISAEEYVARKFASQGRWLDSSGRLPPSAFHQLGARIAEEKGFPRVERTDPLYIGMQEKTKRMATPAPHDEQGKYINAAKRAEDPTGKKQAGKLDKRVASRRTVGGIDINPDYNTADFIKAVEALGFDEATANAVARWYDELGPLFLGYAKGMDDESLMGLASIMEQKMPSLGKIEVTPDNLDDVRMEVGARIMMAWAATQVRTSPRDGFGYILMLMDELTRGKRSGKDSIGLFDDQRNQLAAMLENYEDTIRVRGVSAKLSDFIDSVLGNRTRSWMLGQADEAGVRPLTIQTITSKGWTPGPGQAGKAIPPGTQLPIQPAAMDVWMGRSFGFIDTPYIGYLAAMIRKQKPTLTLDEAMVQAQIETGVFASKSVTKIDEKGREVQVRESKEAYRARMAAFEKQHNVTLREEWNGSPSADEYEWMIRRTNQMVDDLNAMNDGLGYLGKGYGQAEQWVAADIQALEWMRIQKALGIDPGGPNNMFHQNAAQVSFEVTPQTGGLLHEAVPMWRASADAKDNITGDIATLLASMVEDATGAQITRVVPGMGGWTGKTGEYMVSPNTFWEVMGSEGQIKDAIAYISLMTQQRRVFATRTPLRIGGKSPLRNRYGGKGRRYNWGIDFVPRDMDVRTLDALRQYIDKSGFAWNGSTVGTRAGDITSLRTVFDGPRNKKDAKTLPPGYTQVPDALLREEFEAAVPLPDELREALESGRWAVDADFDEAPIPVTIERDLHEILDQVNDYEADAKRAHERILSGEDQGAVWREEIGKEVLGGLRDRGRSHVAHRVVDWDMATVSAAYDDALKRHAGPGAGSDGDVWSVGRGEHDFLRAYGEASPVPHLLQDSPRGWRGASAWVRRRGATERVAQRGIGPRRGRLYFKEGESDLTSVSHELFHFFVDDMDPSMVEHVHGLWYDSLTPNQQRKTTKPTGNSVTREAQEWLAYQYEEWVGSGIAKTGTLNAGFRAFAESFPTMVGRDPNKVSKGVRKLFEGLTPDLHRGPPATYHVDQFRMMEATRVALLRAEEEAFRVHYYKRGRTLMERSINHPYLGFYPASYMWGKVLPELLRFLVAKPFGIDAPFAGMAAANHVYEAIQLQMNTDEGFEGFVQDFPEALRFLTLMIPGTPFDLPVNLPAWLRRVAQDEWQGDDPNIFGHLSDTILYAFGPGRAPADLAEFVGQGIGAAQRVQQQMAGTYVPPEEEKRREDAQKRLVKAGWLAPEPDEDPMLEYQP